MTHSDLVSAVVVVGGKAGECAHLLAAEAGDLGHAHQDGDSRSQPDTIDAGDQVEARGEVAVPADCGDQRGEFDLEKAFEAHDLLVPDTPDTLVAAGLAAGL